MRHILFGPPTECCFRRRCCGRPTSKSHLLFFFIFSAPRRTASAMTVMFHVIMQEAVLYYYQMWSFSKSNFNHLNLTYEKILQNLTSSQTSFFFLNSLFHYSSGNKQTKKQIENYLTKNGCFVQLLSCSSQTHERQRCVFKSCCRLTKEKKRKKQKKLSRLWVPALVKPTHVKVVLPPSPSALPSDRMPMWF